MDGIMATESSAPAPPLLQSSDLNILPLSKIKYAVKLFHDRVVLTELQTKSKKVTTVLLDDVIGVDCLKGKKENDPACYFSLYAYEHKKKVIGKTTARQRRVISVVFNHKSAFDDNFKECVVWKTEVIKILRKEEISKQLGVVASDLKKWLFMVNPNSGPGKALQIFQQRVVPMLAEAGIEYKVVVTDHAGHGTEIMTRLQLQEWYCVVIVSGDGLIYEVINGLMKRADWQEAIKFPVGCLPGGSGNALSCALSHAAKEPYLEAQVLHATHLLLKHRPLPLDLCALETWSGRRIYSFLSLAWGLISDVDIESEKYRSIGNFRFTLGAIMGIMSLKKYRGRVSFLPCEKYTPRLAATKLLRRSQSEYAQQSGQGQVKVTAVKRGTSMMQQNPHEAGTDLNRIAAAGDSGARLGKSESIAEGEEVGEGEGGAENGVVNDTGKSAAQRPVFELNEATEADLNGPSAVSQGDTGDSPGPELTLLPPLSEPVPSDWVTIDDEFITVLVAYLSHLGPDLIVDPNIRLSGDDLYLVLIKHNATRSRVLKLFLAMADGTADMNTEGLELVRVKAFRLEPLSPTGHIAVDGELIEYGPIQGQMMPGSANVMGRETRL